MAAIFNKFVFVFFFNLSSKIIYHDAPGI